MKNSIREKRYITSICNHLAELGYFPKAKGSSLSRYTRIGATTIRISNHVGFSPKALSIIISGYSKDIIISFNGQLIVLHSLKEVKNFLNVFVFL